MLMPNIKFNRNSFDTSGCEAKVKTKKCDLPLTVHFIHFAQRTHTKNSPRSEIHCVLFWHKINSRIEINITKMLSHYREISVGFGRKGMHH